MSCFRLAASYRDHTDPSTRPPKANWLDKHDPDEIALLPTDAPLRRSFMYWSRLYWATPPWLTESQRAAMKELYEACPVGSNVDHIVPLDSKIVCGLHVPWNLQHMGFAENMRKSNTWWPDHPFENQDLFEEVA